MHDQTVINQYQTARWPQQEIDYTRAFVEEIGRADCDKRFGRHGHALVFEGPFVTVRRYWQKRRWVIGYEWSNLFADEVSGNVYQRVMGWGATLAEARAHATDKNATDKKMIGED